MSKIRVRQSKNRLRSDYLDQHEINELRSKIRDPAYIDHVLSQLAGIIYMRIFSSEEENQKPKNKAKS